jgi:ribonuclease BN (tRNA processing enzyme)
MEKEDAMQVIFAGVGEAFDERLPNTAIIVSAGAGKGKRQVLLDCGFTAPLAFWQVSPAPLALDGIWISHFHGDHFFGVPLLLLRFWEERREKPLTIIGQTGIEDRVHAALDLAYSGLRSKIRYPIQFEEAFPGKDTHMLGFQWSFAETGHSTPCYAIRLNHKEGSLFYSGDGSPTDDTLALAKGCRLIVHEAFGIENVPLGHGTVDRCLDFARKAGAKAMALVHMNRDARQIHGEEVKKMLASLQEFSAFLPEPGVVFELDRLPST